LLYSGEVRAMRDIDIPKTDVKPAELKLAQQLIEQQSSDKFDPAAYTDEVPETGAQVIDLMEALRASLGKKAAPATKPAADESRKPPKRAQAEPAQRKAAKK